MDFTSIFKPAPPPSHLNGATRADPHSLLSQLLARRIAERVAAAALVASLVACGGGEPDTVAPAACVPRMADVVLIGDESLDAVGPYLQAELDSVYGRGATEVVEFYFPGGRAVDASVAAFESGGDVRVVAFGTHDADAGENEISYGSAVLGLSPTLLLAIPDSSINNLDQYQAAELSLGIPVVSAADLAVAVVVQVAPIRCVVR